MKLIGNPYGDSGTLLRRRQSAANEVTSTCGRLLTQGDCNSAAKCNPFATASTRRIKGNFLLAAGVYTQGVCACD